MRDIISVKNISKFYNIQHERIKYKSLRDDVVNFAKHPFSAFSEKSEKFYALKDISFSVKAGETLGIIGPNGAGKSTLLKILSRVTPPSKGEIRFHGRVASLLEVGTGFHPELTGRENIFLSGAVLGMKQYEIKRKFDEIVDFADTEKFLDTPVKHYSSGMYTRLAFSVAAHLEPEILIVDEVLAVGDASFQKKCLGKMTEVGKEGRTIIFVSHNMGAISELCRKTIWLEQGKVKKIGDTSSVVSKYLSMISKKSIVNFDNSISTKSSSLIPKKIYITDRDSNPTSIIDFGEPFTLHLVAKAQQKLEDFTISLTIGSILGHPIYNSQITSKELSLKKVEPINELELLLEMNPNIFGSGTYNLGISIQSKKETMNFGSILTFTISEKISKFQKYIMYDGYAVYPRKWQLKLIQ